MVHNNISNSFFSNLVRMTWSLLLLVVLSACSSENTNLDNPALGAANAASEPATGSATTSSEGSVADTQSQGTDQTTTEPEPEPEPQPEPGPNGVIFESNFSDDTGFYETDIATWNQSSTAPPKGWSGIKVIQDSVISVETGEGVGGSNALKLLWDPNLSQPTVSLAKHLTGNENTGYEELYVRYHVRLPNNFRIGSSGNGINHWKWGRFYQNTSPANTGTGKWTENRANSGFVVWNFAGNVPYTDANVTWAENTGSNLDKGSAGGERQKIDYYVSGSDHETAPGYFESLWDMNTTNRPGQLEDNTGQSWHTLEFRFKLASSTNSDDGEFEMWWDGVNQGQYARIIGQGGAATSSGIPTAKRGSGWNFFVFFDNLSGWNADWDTPGAAGHIYVNDVVLSTSRIGHSYQVE